MMRGQLLKACLCLLVVVGMIRGSVYSGCTQKYREENGVYGFDGQDVVCTTYDEADQCLKMWNTTAEDGDTRVADGSIDYRRDENCCTGACGALFPASLGSDSCSYLGGRNSRTHYVCDWDKNSE